MDYFQAKIELDLHTRKDLWYIGDQKCRLYGCEGELYWSGLLGDCVWIYYADGRYISLEKRFEMYCGGSAICGVVILPEERAKELEEDGLLYEYLRGRDDRFYCGIAKRVFKCESMCEEFNYARDIDEVYPLTRKRNK
jgi:hypothetical protein